ncbi:unnamed protein product [Meloidogyne enterolobii]|uniref:Uncharacterized protein n=1 Tax=Meloidogyne enterolobii TaxID=390850 RepID=A0ACB1AFH2_MELEN
MLVLMYKSFVILRPVQFIPLAFCSSTVIPVLEHLISSTILYDFLHHNPYLPALDPAPYTSAFRLLLSSSSTSVQRLQRLFIFCIIFLLFAIDTFREGGKLLF